MWLPAPRVRSSAKAQLIRELQIPLPAIQRQRIMKRYRTCRTRQCVLNATLAFCRVVKDRHATMQAGCVHRKLKLCGSQKTHLRCILYDELIDGGSPQWLPSEASGKYFRHQQSLDASLLPLSTASPHACSGVGCTNPQYHYNTHSQCHT